MDFHPQNWGNARPTTENDFEAPSAPITRTQQPVVTGTSVLAIKYKDGIMMVADTLASYGSLAQIRDMRRIEIINEHTIIGAGGDMSDWQHIQHVLETETTFEYYNEDGHTLHPEHIHEFLARVMYERRSKSDPLWNSLIVGGYKDKPFLGYVDYQGTTYESSTIATGYGSYIAIPLLRKAVEGKEDTLTEEEAIKILNDSMRVLFYRDARSLNKVIITVNQ